MSAPGASTLADYTLVVPTYNRPLKLAGLLRHLERQPVRFPILVLDSSSDVSRAANAAFIRTLDLDVRLLTYDASMTPFEKFWRGAEVVATEYCSLCADDDVLLVDALPPLVAHLRAHGDFSAAHGWYFNFSETAHVGVTAVMYAGPSNDAEAPLRRVRTLFERYEAVTYALYRTDVLRRALREVQRVDSMLARELLAGALTVVAGKVARLPLFYYGRSLAPSEPYVHWHPVDFLISSPERLLIDYARYREILAEALGKSGEHERDRAEVLVLLDLVHTRYLCDYINPRVMDHLITQVMAGADRSAIMKGYWPLLVPPPSLVPPRPWWWRPLKIARDRLAPGLRRHDLRRAIALPGERRIASVTAGGRARTYLFHAAFLSEVRRLGAVEVPAAIDGIVRSLDSYEVAAEEGR
jgi:glycosyltransferase domain-containing protein